MFKRLLAKWKIWEQALDGIDDLRGDHLVHLENRVLRLEREMTKLLDCRHRESEIEEELSLDNLRTGS